MFVGVTARLCALMTVLACTLAARADGPALSILPLGDSITYGLGYNTPGGYRTQLALDLLKLDISPVFVGSSQDNSSQTLLKLGMAAHEGHPGYRIDDLANNLDGVAWPSYNNPNNGGYWLPGGHGTGRPALYPDVVTLLIGNNDIAQRYDPNGQGNVESDDDLLAHMEARLSALIGQIAADRPAARVFVSGLIPIEDSRNSMVLQYNAAIRDVIVPSFAAAGQSVYFVDQYHNFVDADGNFIPGSQPDSVHPDQAGYNRMGDTWAQAITSEMPAFAPENLTNEHSNNQGGTVPEPSPMGILGLAIMARWMASRRRRHACKQRSLPRLDDYCLEGA